MVKRILENGLNVKDETRLANATAKLTSSQLGDSYSFDTSVQPVMIAGIEENTSLSTVDLISCLRDQNGVNRLCVDNRGIATQSKEQSFLGASLFFQSTTTASVNTSEASIPSNKINFITSLIFSNGSTAHPHSYEVTYNSPNSGYPNTTAIIDVNVPASSTIVVSNLMIPLYTNDIFTITVFPLLDANANLDSVSVLGVIQ